MRTGNSTLTWLSERFEKNGKWEEGVEKFGMSWSWHLQMSMGGEWGERGAGGLSVASITQVARVVKGRRPAENLVIFWQP